jgi:hypothetical protein
MTASTDASVLIGARRQRAPDFFIVGHPKCGTTALYEMLKRQPGVYMPELKEPVFLADDLRAGVRRSVVKGRPETLEEYLALFGPARAEQRVGEASALYLWSHDAAARIAELQPDARIIAILREPVSFLHSLHMQLLQDHSEMERDLRKALALEHERRQGRRIPRDCPRPPALIYSEYLRYVDQLRRYHAVFPPEQVLVLIYDDFRRDNEATMRTVLRFLDLDDTAPLEAIEANPTVRLRARRLDRALRNVSTGRGPVTSGLRRAIKRVSSRRLRHRALLTTRRRVVYAEPPPPDTDLALELRHDLKAEVTALSEYLDRDLVALWGYDRID